MHCEILEKSKHPDGISIHPVYHFLFAGFLLHSLDTIPELNILFWNCSPKPKFEYAV